MRSVAASILVHVLAIALLVASHATPSPPRTPAAPAPVALTRAEVVTDVTFVDEPAVKAGGGTSPATPSARRTAAMPRRSTVDAADARTTAWAQVSIRMDDGVATGTGPAELATGHGHGSGAGVGDGRGNGIGFGDGGGVRVADEVPRPPPPPAVGKARPAKLVWPTRDVEVDDDANLFIARVTVDAEGDVVGARMIKARSGARADHAANAIWQFRYAPALDDRGVPTRSTFDQPFQIR